MAEWEVLKERPAFFTEFQATVVWAGAGFMVVNVVDKDEGGFTTKEAMKYMQEEHPDADEILIRARTVTLNPDAPGRYPLYVEGSSNPWL